MNVPLVGLDDVKVNMLAAPINPSDINSIQGKVVTMTTMIYLRLLQDHIHYHHSYQQLVVMKWLA